MSDQVKLGSPEHRARIIRNATRTRDKIRQIFADVEHWNRCHPDDAPIDPDPDGQLKRMLDGLEFTLACEERAGGIGPIEPFNCGLGEADDERPKH